MKYEFIQVDEDNVKLVYRDKEFNIKRDVDLQRRIADISHKAKLKMAFDLSAMGKTKKDLTIERHDGNKTIYDNSNYMEIEQEYIGLAMLDYLNEVSDKYFSMDLEKLLIDVGINISNQGTDEQNKFMLDFINALNGKADSPSQKK